MQRKDRSEEDGALNAESDDQNLKIRPTTKLTFAWENFIDNPKLILYTKFVEKRRKGIWIKIDNSNNF